MKSLNKWGWNIRAVVRTVTILVLAVIVAGPVFTPAFGDDRDHRDRDYHGDRDRHDHGDRDRHRGYERHGRYYWHGEWYDSPPPGYYAPPPPQVYAPPPPPPGITFVFPLRFR